ncbi:unnamed protein product [Rotaria sp. Silwood1]|nr:unnamed protein product [Rotaria sp. Silwood1]CAF4902484.1 unnamed protein product [Rotaria sp. Silwood1]CAF5142979.1 unnamed protein product [Rotaria sp. Silwood1]
MNRSKFNAVSIGLLNDLEQAFDHASKNDHIKGVHLRSNFSSTFSAGLVLFDMHERCAKRHQPIIDKFVFDTINRGAIAPLRCSKLVACSLDGHAIGAESSVGVPFPTISLEIMRHQLEPQLVHRLIFDANITSSNDFSIRCE